MQQIPAVAFLKISGTPDAYLAHARDLVGFLIDKPDRRVSTPVLRAFLDSDNGKRIKEGGDLLVALQRGPLTEMLYTFKVGYGGSPSKFITVDGMQEVVKGLQNQTQSSKQQLARVIESLVPVPAHAALRPSFVVATKEQCAQYMDDDGIIEEIYTTYAGGGNGSFSMSGRMLNDVRCSFLLAEKRVMQSQLQLKDAEANQMAAQYECRLKDTAFQYECRLKAAELKNKDAEIERLKLELKHQQERSEWERGRARKRGAEPLEEEDDEEVPMGNVTKARWVISYKGDNALQVEDFVNFDGVRAIETTKVDERWFSLLLLDRPRRFLPIKRQLQKLRTEFKIRGTFWIECYGGMERFNLFQMEGMSVVREHMKSSKKLIVFAPDKHMFPFRAVPT